MWGWEALCLPLPLQAGFWGQGIMLDSLLKFWIWAKPGPYAAGKQACREGFLFHHLGDRQYGLLRLLSARDYSVWASCGFIIVREDFRGSLVTDLQWNRTRGTFRDLRVTSLKGCSRHMTRARELSGSWVSTMAVRPDFTCGWVPNRITYLWGNLRSARGPEPNRLSMRGGHPLLNRPPPTHWGRVSQLKYELTKAHLLCSPGSIYPGALWAHCQCQW